MRAGTIALAAIPVLLAGMGLAVVAGGINPLSPFLPASEDTPVSPGTESAAGSHDSVTGTQIDGRRPHLSVIDGRANLFLPTPLPAILSLLPGSTVELAPLPSEPDGPDTSAPSVPTGAPDAPAVGAGPSPGNQTAHRATRPPAAPAGGAPSAAPLRQPETPTSPPPTTDPSPPRPIADPRYDHDVFTMIADEIMNHVHPPQNDTQGPPPHAGQAGPPDHAGTQGPPPHAGQAGHAGTPGAQNHAGGGTQGGGAQLVNASRPGPR